MPTYGIEKVDRVYNPKEQEPIANVRQRRKNDPKDERDQAVVAAEEYYN